MNDLRCFAVNKIVEIVSANNTDFSSNQLANVFFFTYDKLRD